MWNQGFGRGTAMQFKLPKFLTAALLLVGVSDVGSNAFAAETQKGHNADNHQKTTLTTPVTFEMSADKFADKTMTDDTDKSATDGVLNTSVKFTVTNDGDRISRQKRVEYDLQAL